MVKHLIALLLLMIPMDVVNGLNILVFGGTGFVGSKIVSKLTERGHSVVSLSRRPQIGTNPKVTYISGDAADKATCLTLAKKHGPFDAAIHCIGLLLDADSGLSSLNKFASGSGSIPSIYASYDQITRQTAFNMIDVILQQGRPQASKQIPTVFVSAAEAAWTFPAPVLFLERYLVAKRAVEKRLLENQNALRATILRPSLIYTMDRPQALLSVVPFFIGNAIGLPFVDRPVSVDTLSNAAVYAIENDGVSGIKGYREMGDLGGRLKDREL